MGFSPIAVLGYGYDLGFNFGFGYDDEKFPPWISDNEDNDLREALDFANDILLAAAGHDVAALGDGRERRAAIEALEVGIVEHRGSNEPHHLVCTRRYVTDWDDVATIESLFIEDVHGPAQAIRRALESLSIPVPDGPPKWILSAHAHI